MTNRTIDTLVEEDDASSAANAREAWLLSIGSPEDNFAHAASIYRLHPPLQLTFCRDDTCDAIEHVIDEHEAFKQSMRLPFGWVSGTHARLHANTAASRSPDHGIEVGIGSTFTLEDLGSRNGTLVNGQRIEGPTKLRPGDVFEIGRSFWTIRLTCGMDIASKAADFDAIGTCSPHLFSIHHMLRRLAPSTIPVLLRGETGTGKEHLARALHGNSGRPGAFVVANLAALREVHVRELLCGANGQAGLFAQAAQGTLMLDELGAIDSGGQAALVAALSSPPNDRAPRIVSCTTTDLAHKVEARQFRADLYSRLSGYIAELPPLRARREDLGLLCRAMVRGMHRHGVTTRITSNAFRRVLTRVWPFNVRQLAQSLHAASLLATGEGTITAAALSEVLDQDDGLPQSPDDVRHVRAALVRHLAEFSGDTNNIASAMGRDPYQIQRWLERFELEPERYRTAAANS